MDCALMATTQKTNQVVDVALWQRSQEFAQYPVGAREKTLLYCSSLAPYPFLRAGHLYLFKHSVARYPEQFWVEIFAYRLGVLMGVPVPPAFAAFDSATGQPAALIEWFLEDQQNRVSEIYVAGGDYCQQYIPEYERTKGRQHNFKLITQICEDLERNSKLQKDWLVYWAKALLFDALIGNTDRHQDNWGTIQSSGEMRLAPVFDNGTSMGHEQHFKKMDLFKGDDHLKRYVIKGVHHMKWNVSDSAGMGHGELLKRMITQYPQVRLGMLECLQKIDESVFKLILDELVAFDVPVKLTAQRAELMLRLLQFRYKYLLNELEK